MGVGRLPILAISKLESKLPYGLRVATQELHREIVNRLHHIQGRRRARKYRSAIGLRLHLGCGSVIKPGWLNIDLHPKADLNLDLREPLPFPSQSAKLIYSEHVFECFAYPEPIGSLLRECLRILQPGGILSFAVPDGHLVLEHYLKNNHPEVEEAHNRLNPEWCSTPMDHVNYCFRGVNGVEQRWYYDVDSVHRLLERTGFCDVRQRSFDPSLDQAVREIGSLYVECRKPAVCARSFGAEPA